MKEYLDVDDCADVVDEGSEQDDAETDAAGLPPAGLVDSGSCYHLPSYADSCFVFLSMSVVLPPAFLAAPLLFGLWGAPWVAFVPILASSS